MSVTVSVKWNGKKFDDVIVNLNEPASVFKSQLFSLTGVEPERQKVLVKGGMLKDETDLKSVLKEVRLRLKYIGLRL
jgi:ubiquitin carboxyl-terminal hydrolase 14